jgi:RNA-directed DNA polymerase
VVSAELAQPLAAQHQTLSQKLRGHFAYFGITGNSFALSRFPAGVIRIWKNWLSRRQRCGFLSWEVFERLLRRYPLPPASTRCAVPSVNP